MNKIILIVIVIGLIIVGVALYVNQNKNSQNNESDLEVLPAQEVGEKVISFVNNNLLRGEATASLIDIFKDNGLYKIKFDIDGQEIESYATLNGKLLFPEAINLTEAQEPAIEAGITIGNFSVSNDEICQENGKPIVYFFGSNSCSYCKWEHPVMEAVAAKFGNEISFHNNMDKEEDTDILEKYSTGYIPTIILGCKYYRVGAGQSDGEEIESQNLTALICKLTGNKPENVCSEVQDLINQIQ